MISAVSSTLKISSLEKSSRSSTCRRLKTPLRASTAAMPSISTPLRTLRMASAIVVLLPRRDNLVHTVHLDHVDRHVLVAGGGNVLAYKVGPYRELPVASVHQRHQPDHLRSPVVDEGVHGSSNGTARVEDIIHQNDASIGDVDGNVRGSHRQRPPGEHVVAIHCYVQLPEWHAVALELADAVCDTLGQGDAARSQSHQHQLARALVPLDYLVGDPGEGAPHVVRGHYGPASHDPLLHKAKKDLPRRPNAAQEGPPGSIPLPTPFRPHRTGLKVIGHRPVIDLPAVLYHGSRPFIKLDYRASGGIGFSGRLDPQQLMRLGAASRIVPLQIEKAKARRPSPKTTPSASCRRAL